MIYELRQYYIDAEKREEWIQLMDEKVIPFQKSMGMMVVGSFFSLDQADLYVWLRCYENEEHKQSLYDKVYGSDYWKNHIRPQVDAMLQRERSQVTMLVPTRNSMLQ
jgi:hypothetical protein